MFVFLRFFFSFGYRLVIFILFVFFCYCFAKLRLLFRCFGLLFWFDGMVMLALMLFNFIFSCYLAGWMLVPVLASMVFGLVGCLSI